MLKSLLFIIGSLSAVIGGVVIAATKPAIAWASGGGRWTPEEMLNAAGADASISATPISAGSVTSFVNTLTAWLVGIAVAIFVLRVVLTAINRMVFGNGTGKSSAQGQGGSSSSSGLDLTAIPLIGAYPDSDSWANIWKRFIVQLAIVAGAWFIVQLLMGIILWIFGEMSIS